MSGLVEIKSPSEWQSLLSGTTIVVADFYADWCGPCKQIAPIFQRLATQYASPKKVAFAKVNVDSQPEVAQQNRVSAMPTFKIFQNGSCIQTIQGADPTGLSQAVAKAVQLAGAGKAHEAGFKTPGRTLGGESASRPSSAVSSLQLGNLLSTLISFIGLYLVSFFSFDGQKAAEQSRFNVHNAQQSQTAASGSRAGFGSGSGSGSGAKPSGSSTRPQQRAAFKTLADL
ncbi:hypothetical protein E4U35_002495 [Claviceps purpurea]|nr:hypothetical protein E4U35_002495 [Claviceps purpurea]KAG6224534.1 hypothetical protein E4U34_000244 [Claviceps purpurea]KAG6236605.1 hypothetical protein E4U25_003525 [Claviceps purpurea]KAG6305804.1 hypothetical protein E4U45_008303 [Claviceps purpurea]